MIDWKQEWNECFPNGGFNTGTRVKVEFIRLYKEGMSFAQLSLYINRRISASGIRSMIIKEGVKLRGRGGKH